MSGRVVECNIMEMEMVFFKDKFDITHEICKNLPFEAYKINWTHSRGGKIDTIMIYVPGKKCYLLFEEGGKDFLIKRYGLEFYNKEIEGFIGSVPIGLNKEEVYWVFNEYPNEKKFTKEVIDRFGNKYNITEIDR